MTKLNMSPLPNNFKIFLLILIVNFLADQESVTFYNDDDGWSFTSPIKPLLNNTVIKAMLTGEFKEATTKRIQVPDFPRSVVERFIQDLTSSELPRHLEPNRRHIEHLQLARLAHRFDAEKLATAYLGILFNMVANGRVLHATLHYELCRAVFELSAEDFYSAAARQIAQQTETIFENDDAFLLKNLCDEYEDEDRRTISIFYNNDPHPNRKKMKSCVHSIIQHKAHGCLKVLLDYVPLDFNDLKPCTSDLTLPEDLISKLLKTAPTLKDDFIRHHNAVGVGVALREFPDDQNYWGNAFHGGFMEIIRFAPKAMLLQNDVEFVSKRDRSVPRMDQLRRILVRTRMEAHN